MTGMVVISGCQCDWIKGYNIAGRTLFPGVSVRVWKRMGGPREEDPTSTNTHQRHPTDPEPT